MKREEVIAKLEEIAERVAAPAGIEIVELELKGAGKAQLLRIYIDKPEGVTHGDCELVSRQMSEILDQEDPIPGTYQLEVSSPGVERNLKKWKDWERFIGQKVKVVFKEPLITAAGAPLKHFEGTILSAVEPSVTVEPSGSAEPVTFLFDQVDRANLKFEW